MMIGGYGPPTTTAQIPVSDAEFVNDGTLYIYASLDGKNLKDSPQGDPVIINMDDPMILYLQINVSESLTHDLNMSGSITFYYQGIAIFPIQIVDYATNSTWIHVYHDSAVPVIEAPIGLGQAFTTYGIKLTTGIFQASIDFRYYIEGDPVTEHLVTNQFYFSIPPGSPIEVITSVAGISATAATVAAVFGVGRGFWSLFEGMKTAYKIKGIHKKASELKSLPNLTVIGALPLLFSMLAGMGKMSKKKTEDGREDSGVSEYLVRQRLRETAPDAWPVDKCPKCKRNWNKKTDFCKKCNFTQDDARVYYADLLSEKVPIALKVLGKKKSTDIRTLAKKTKSTDYNAGIIAAAMVDTGVTEIVKVGTPLRSFVMNIAGLAFLVITWQQLLGDNASTLQTTLTLIGAAMSFAIIIALYVSRRSQVEKFHSEAESDAQAIPTEEEPISEDVEKAEVPSEEEVEEIPDEGISQHEDSDMAQGTTEEEDVEEDFEPETSEDDYSDEDEESDE